MLLAARAEDTTPSATARSAVTNGTRLLAGVDGRSAIARRYRDLYLAFADELGGLAALSAADLTLVRATTACALRAEHLQAEIVRGAAIDSNELVRLNNSLARSITALRRKGSRARESGSELATDQDRRAAPRMGIQQDGAPPFDQTPGRTIDTQGDTQRTT